MADTTIQKQGEVFISQSEYDALRLAGNLQSNTKYHITKTPKTGVNSLEQMNLLNGDKTVTYNTTDGMTINGQARFTYDGGTTKDVTMDIDLPIVAGGGITIDKVNGQEKVKVKLDYVSASEVILGVTQFGAKVLTRDGQTTDYVDFGQMTADALAQYTPDTKLQAVTDDEEITDLNTDAVLVNKAYANKHYLAKSEGIPGQTRVYTVRRDNNGSFQENVYLDTNYTEYSVAQRAPGGVLRVGTPVGVNDATTKAYVDGLHHYSHHIHITNGTSEIFITLAIKDYPDAVTDLGSATELVGVLTGEMQPIMATGVVYGHNVHAVFVQSDRKLYAKYYDSAKNIIMEDKVDVLLPGIIQVSDIVA